MVSGLLLPKLVNSWLGLGTTSYGVEALQTKLILKKLYKTIN